MLAIGHRVRHRPAPLEQFVGNPPTALPQLRNDLERLVFQPGGSDGEPLFGA